MNPYAIYSLVSFVAAFTLGLVVYYHNPRNRLNQLFLYLSIALSGWAFVEFGYRQAKTFEEAQFWNSIDHFWVAAIPLMLHMILLFTERTRLLSRKSTYVALYLPAVLIGAADMFTDKVTGPPVMSYWGWTYQIPSLNMYSGLSLFWSLTTAAISISLLIGYYRRKKHNPDIRRGTLLVIASALVTFLSGLISESHILFHGINIPHTTVQSFTLSSILLGISIWKYKLFIIMPGSLAETVFENMTDALFLLSRDYHIVQANQSAFNLLGASPDEVIGRPLQSFVIDSKNTGDISSLIQNEKSDNICDKTAAVKCGENKTCPVAITIVPLPSGRTGKQAALCVMRDMTERCEAERKLRQYQEGLEDIVVERTRELLQANRMLTREVAEHTETEAELARNKSRFQEIVDMLPEIVYELDCKGMVLFANQQTFIMTGYSMRDVEEGFFSLDLIAPEDRERAFKNIQAILAGQTVSTSEFTILRKDKSRMPVLSKNGPIYHNGNIVGVRGIFVDITERKKTEQEIMNYERRFRDMLENINLIALMIDTNGIITFCNDYLLEITGWTSEELIGKSSSDILIPKEERDRLKRIILSGDIPPHLENEILTKSGRRRLVAWNNTVLHDPYGKVIGINSIGEDITDQRNLEQQFHQAQKMESVGRLAGGIAHDFNNLLTIIMGNAEIGMMSSPEEEPVHNYLSEIKRTASRAADLTRQLLTFSRYQIAEAKTVNINKTLLSMDVMLRRLIGEDIEIVLLLDDTLYPVRIDPGQFGQVITNLAVNARDAMPDGGVLTIRTENRIIDAEMPAREVDLEDGEYVCISVSDTGMGMDDEVKRHLFEPFFTTKELGKGTGLGLATCYGIIGHHNGVIVATSESGSGTTIQIFLPRTYEGVEQAASTSDDPSEVSGTESVLLVEDEMGLNRTLIRMLDQSGYHVTSASNGEEALRIARKTGLNAFDIVVTDVVMPRMGGRELISHIREIDPEIRVLYMSGYTDSNLAAEDLDEPGCEFIQKPFTTSSFIRKIRTLLDRVTDIDASIA